MEKQECQDLVTFMSVTWDKSLDIASITARAQGYWAFVQDLDYATTKAAVKQMGLAGRKWMPRPGELRLQVLSHNSGEELPPEPEEAWTILQSIGQKIYAGTYDYAKPHPVLAQTIRRLGTGATALTTNADRTMFTSIYEKTREAWILERFSDGPN